MRQEAKMRMTQLFTLSSLSSPKPFQRGVFDDNWGIILYISLNSYVVTPHLYSLEEIVRMRGQDSSHEGHNICFYPELTKIIPNYHQILPPICSFAFTLSWDCTDTLQLIHNLRSLLAVLLQRIYQQAILKPTNSCFSSFSVCDIPYYLAIRWGFSLSRMTSNV